MVTSSLSSKGIQYEIGNGKRQIWGRDASI